ncbi:cation:proton antiporter [Kaarinaea lacus]
MHLDPILPISVSVLFGILLIGLLFQKFGQPHIIGYLLVGVFLGPHGINLIPDSELLNRLGSIGVVFLMFFIGMEVSPRKLIEKWKITVFGTLFQIGISVLVAWLLGRWLDWPIARSILIGFVISLSSTAVVLKLLQQWRELDSHVGQNVLGILLFQDIAVVPMLIIISLLGGDKPSLMTLSMQIAGMLLISLILFFVLTQKHVKLPFSTQYKKDHELQVFAALIVCFGLATLTGLLGLSTALGAFVAGMVVARTREIQWVHHSLNPFRVVFIALFFASVGMLVNLNFIHANWPQILLLVLAVFVTNTFINAVVLRALGEPWKQCLYASALLAQIGEFSFVLALIGYQAKIISEFGYQLTIAIIATTLLFSPIWIAITKLLTITIPTTTSDKPPE